MCEVNVSKERSSSPHINILNIPRPVLIFPRVRAAEKDVGEAPKGDPLQMRSFLSLDLLLLLPCKVFAYLL
jgi:hypothetical protein